MKKYLGVKIVSAEPAIKGWNLEESKSVSADMLQEGYKVVYEDGYQSWSPKDVFEKAYKEIGIVADKKERIGILANPSDGEWDIIGHVATVEVPRELGNTVEELFTIVQNLEEAAKYGLQYEVVHASLKAMKENPNLSVDAAIVTGYNEWVK